MDAIAARALLQRYSDGDASHEELLLIAKELATAIKQSAMRYPKSVTRAHRDALR